MSKAKIVLTLNPRQGLLVAKALQEYKQACPEEEFPEVNFMCELMNAAVKELLDN